MAKTARDAYVWRPSLGKSVLIAAGTDHTAVPAEALGQMLNPGMWEGGTVPAAVGAAPAPVQGLRGQGLAAVVVTTKEAHNALVAAGTARSDTLYLYPKA